VELNVAGNSTSSSILPMANLHLDAAPQSKYVAVESAPLRRLDSVVHPAIQKSASILLKIDTQGYEEPVIRGAEALLPRLRGLQLELSLTGLYAGQVLYREMLDTMNELGFELWTVIPGFADRTSGRLLQMDGVFFRANSA
jgi:hypothetical protein